ncbi:MAG: hypothetical protein RBT64_13510, partial [Trichloromonas sp.]|nr:hypothetical protein [Trichloromonas sp.]
RAVEIYDISTDWFLTQEFKPSELPFAEDFTPDRQFSLSRVSAILAGKLSQFFIVGKKGRRTLPPALPYQGGS